MFLFWIILYFLVILNKLKKPVVFNEPTDGFWCELYEIFQDGSLVQ